MEVNEHYVCPRHRALSSDMKNIERAIRCSVTTTHRMWGGIDAHRHPGKTFDFGHMSEAHKVTMRITQIRLHATQCKNQLAIALTDEIIGRVQRFLQRHAKASFDESRELLLPAEKFQQFGVLQVSRTELEHDTGRLTGCLECVMNFVDI